MPNWAWADDGLFFAAGKADRRPSWRVLPATAWANSSA
jgi:hypothetical protein